MAPCTEVGSALSQACQDRKKPESTQLPASHQHTSHQTGSRSHAPAALGTVGAVTWVLACEHPGRWVQRECRLEGWRRTEWGPPLRPSCAHPTPLHSQVRKAGKTSG